MCQQILEQTISLEGIPKVDEQQARELWEDVHRKAIDNWSNTNISPPFFEMNLEQPEWNEGQPDTLKDKFLSLYFEPQLSKPSNLGEYIDRAATFYVLSMRKP